MAYPTDDDIRDSRSRALNWHSDRAYEDVTSRYPGSAPILAEALPLAREYFIRSFIDDPMSTLDATPAGYAAGLAGGAHMTSHNLRYNTDPLHRLAVVRALWQRAGRLQDVQNEQRHRFFFGGDRPYNMHESSYLQNKYPQADSRYHKMSQENIEAADRIERNAVNFAFQNRPGSADDRNSDLELYRHMMRKADDHIDEGARAVNPSPTIDHLRDALSPYPKFQQAVSPALDAMSRYLGEYLRGVSNAFPELRMPESQLYK